jgi:hypothetical protein
VREALEQLVAAVILAATPVLVAFAVQALRALAAKCRIELQTGQVDELHRIASEAVFAVEQKAGTVTLASDEKKRLALAYVRDVARSRGIPEKIVEAAAPDLVEAVVFQTARRSEGV